jgi:tetratricopeptide (TPR) repeat protein
MNRAEILDALYETWQLPYGPARTAAVERLIPYADAIDDPALAVDTRRSLVIAYRYGNEPAKAFAPFSWCLAVVDREPEVIPTELYERLLWTYKGVILDLTRYPTVDLPTIAAALDDLEARYRLGGYGLHGVHNYRHQVARQTGYLATAEEEFRQWRTLPRDQFSDCVGCDPMEQMIWLVQTGRDSEAVDTAERVLSGEFTCDEQPHSILAGLLLPYLRLGRYADAEAARRRAYRMIRDDPDELAAIGQHIEFCALSGNDARGLELIERHLPWLENARDPDAEMSFASCAALQLRRLVEIGHGADQLHDTTVADLEARLRERAMDLAALFDARNGNTARSELIRARISSHPKGQRRAGAASRRLLSRLRTGLR